MPLNPQTDELLRYLNELIVATQKGTIPWRKANPTTYVWARNSPPPAARLTLQNVESREAVVSKPGVLGTVPVRKYIFTASDSSNVTRLSIDSTEHSQVHEMLSTLFEAIETSIARQGLDFLKSILSPT